MILLDALATTLRHWLGAGALDGALFAITVWVASVTCLRRSSGRWRALLWLTALLKFVMVWPIEMHAVPLRAGAYQAVESGHYGALTLLYSSAVTLLLARIVIRQRRLRRSIAAFVPAEPVILECVRCAAARLGLVRIPAVRVTDSLDSPYTVGPLRPTLVLPSWLCTPGERLTAVLLHELAHLQRRDHWFLGLERVLATVFFFWPPVHWVNRKLDEARELACDEHAIQRGGLSASEYARHLVDVVAVAARGGVTPRDALAIGRSAWRLERRIDHLLDGARGQRMGSLQAVGLALLAACFLIALRPAPELRPLSAANFSASPTRESSAGADMSLPETPGPGCLVQSCGTIVCPR